MSTAAYIMLNEVAGQQAKTMIGALMLVTGLSNSIFWPTTGVLAASFGWRTMCLVYAVLILCVNLPLYLFGLPKREAFTRDVASVPAAAADVPVVGKITFLLIIASIALNAFVTFGFSALLVELLKAEGCRRRRPSRLALLLGVIQVSARGLDFLGGGRWDGITTGILAGFAQCVAMFILLAGDGAYWSIAAFIACYGLGSGALAVARATIPLVFYDGAAYAKAASQIALPLNLIAALSPPVLAMLLTDFGSKAVLGLAILCSAGALALMVLLSRRRPENAAAI